jgi:methyltransferase OMS1, mitochondrial
MGLYVALLAPSLISASSPCNCSIRDPPTGRPQALVGGEASKFDRSLDFPEWLTGITRLRQRLAKQADGHILEVAVGTGRNLGFYDWSGLDAKESSPHTPSTKSSHREGVEWKAQGASENQPAILSLTAVDVSVDMLNVALTKLGEIVAKRDKAPPVVTQPSNEGNEGGEVSYMSGKVRLLSKDAQLPLPPRIDSLGQGRTYDTVIQTFGLCSFSDPVSVLMNLASVVEPETGRIILLEHGRGTWDWVNTLLDRQALAHFQKYGCWWNRDIEAIVKQATTQVPGLEIVRLERPHLLQLGTVLYVELRVRHNVV